VKGNVTRHTSDYATRNKRTTSKHACGARVMEVT
jgi:hypothetical protein